MIRQFRRGDRILVSAYRKNRGWIYSYLHQGYEYRSGHNWASSTAVSETRWAIESLDGVRYKNGFETKEKAIKALMSHVEFHLCPS